MRKIVGLICFLCLSTLVFGQDTTILKLSIKEAQDYAMMHNKSLKNARTDALISDKQVWQAISQGLPQASATVDFMSYFNYEMEFGMGGSSGALSLDNIDLTALDAGDFALVSLLQGMMSPTASTITMGNSSSAKLQLQQLIFSGQYWVGIEVAKMGKFLADQNVELTEIDTREMVTSNYYSYLITKKSLEIVRLNLENLQQTLTQTEALLKAGMIESTDVDQINMSIIMLENSEKSLLRNVELTKNLMRFQLGLSMDANIELTETFDDILNSIDFASMLTSTFDPMQNINIRMLQTQEDLSQKMVDMEKWSYGPSLSAVYNYNQKILTTDFDMNPKNMLVLNLSIPIFSSGMRNSKVEEKELELYKVQNNKEIVTDQLLMQEKQLKYNLITALEIYESQAQNVELAKRIYKNTELKYRQGVVSSFDLTQANSSLIEAENSYISSSMELLQAKLAYDKLLSKI